MLDNDMNLKPEVIPAYDYKKEELAQRILREFSTEQGKRGVWESHWQEIAERIWPSMSWHFNPYWYQTAGQKKNEWIFDSTATLSLNRFAAIVDSLLTPRNQTWHSLTSIDPMLNKRRDVKEWFETTNRILFHYRYQGMSNFASQNHMNYKALGAFGNGCLFTDSLSARAGFRGKGLRYKKISLGEMYYVENHQGIIDKCFRYIEMTVRQAIQKWGNALPLDIRGLAEKDPETVQHFIHLVEPRDDYDPERKDHKGMAFASYYISKEHTALLEEGGFHVFPYAISRDSQYPGETYGRSIAMDLLPAIKTLNEEKKAVLKQGHRVTDPVLLAHDDGVLDGFSLLPGRVNMGGVTADGKPLVHALPTGNLQIGKEMMDDERDLIKDGFLVSLFQILTENPQMTATVVLERAKEKGILLAPTIGRQQTEYLSPLIERELDILGQQGLLPQMPQILKEAQGEYKVIYDSPLNRDQRASEASGLMRTVESCLTIAQATQDPAVLDNFDWDVVVPNLAEIQNVPQSWLNTPDKIAAARAERAKQKQMENAANVAPGAAAVMNATAKVHKLMNGGSQGTQ
jgi:hypothetical protein